MNAAMTAASRAALACIVGLMAAVPAQAQFSAYEDIPTRFEWRGNLSTYFDREFETRIDGGDDFNSWRVGLLGDVGGPINESILLGVRAGYQYADYDWNLGRNTNGLPDDPWGGINTVDVAPMATLLVGGQWSVVGSVPIRWSAETGSRNNAMSAGLTGVARWQPTENLRIGLGIGFTSQVESDVETFPVLTLDWAINDSWILATDGNLAQGGFVRLYWGPNPAIRLSLSAGYERNRFRLDDNGNGPDKNGVGEIRSIPIEAGVRIEFLEGAFFEFRGGLGVGGRFRVEDSSGDKLYDQDYDPAPRVSARFSVPFGL